MPEYSDVDEVLGLRRKYAHVRRPRWGLRRAPPLEQNWGAVLMGSVDVSRCIGILQERPGVPRWLARMRGWFEGWDGGGTHKLRAHYGPQWLWEGT
jgi:hypothetical protein